jgi:hypothetical protein
VQYVGEPPAMPDGPQRPTTRVFVSYTQADRSWAEWIAWLGGLPVDHAPKAAPTADEIGRMPRSRLTGPRWDVWRRPGT